MKVPDGLLYWIGHFLGIAMMICFMALSSMMVLLWANLEDERCRGENDTKECTDSFVVGWHILQVTPFVGVGFFGFWFILLSRVFPSKKKNEEVGKQNVST